MLLSFVQTGHRYGTLINTNMIAFQFTLVRYVIATAQPSLIIHKSRHLIVSYILVHMSRKAQHPILQ